jgi:hypothetical protein
MDKELSAADILNFNDIVVTKVDVPEWGGYVYVRGMSGTQRERYLESLRDVKGKGKNQDIKILLVESSAKLAQQTICDKDGNLLFSSAQIKQLGEKSSKALQRVVDASAKLNGFDADAEEEAKNDSAAPTEAASASSSVSH